MRLAWIFGAVAYGAVAVGCSSSKASNGFGETGDGGAFGPPGDGGLTDVHFGGGDGAQVQCVPDPANFEVPGNGCDDDGDGVVDNVPHCDSNLLVTGPAGDFVKALGLCKTATGPNDSSWGVISATFTKGHAPTDAPPEGQHGILPKFGGATKPREGNALGVLSSGFAREFDDATAASGAFKGGVAMQDPLNPTPGGAPPNFPKPAAGCSVSSDVYDVISLKLSIKVPRNAQGLQFDFDFWSGEWPEFVCTDYNDSFVAYLHSTAFNNNAADNVSFDGNHNPVSVNNNFFEICTDNVQTGCKGSATTTSKCPLGPTDLAGTGFSDPGKYCGGQQSSGGGATGWLTTQAPVAPGEVITLEFVIWDTRDANFDSSVLLDNFQWVPGPVQTGTQRPPR